MIDELKAERRAEWAEVMQANQECSLWRSYAKYDNWMTNFENKVYFLPTMAKMKSDGTWVDESGLYTKSMEIVTSLRDNLSKTLADIKVECPDVYLDFTGEKITEGIDALSDTIANHYYFNTLTAIEGEINNSNRELRAETSSLYERALAAQAGSGSSSDQDILYAECQAKLRSLQSYLDQTLADIDKRYPRVSPTIREMVNSQLKSYIDPLVQELDSHYADGTLEEYAPQFNETIDQLKITIDGLYDIAEEMELELVRQENNKKAYDEDLARIEAYSQQGKALYEELKGYDNTKVEDLWQEFTAVIKEETDGATTAYEAVEEKGEYSYVLNVEKIESIINQFNQIKEQMGIEGIGIDSENGNITIYNLRGERVETLVRGQINIVVDAKGNTSKLLVK